MISNTKAPIHLLNGKEMNVILTGLVVSHGEVLGALPVVDVLGGSGGAAKDLRTAQRLCIHPTVAGRVCGDGLLDGKKRTHTEIGGKPRHVCIPFWSKQLKIIIFKKKILDESNRNILSYYSQN